MKKWTGSSPLTRGGLIAIRAARPLLGLIPDYAGRTLSSCASTRENRAHPRLRGADKSTGLDTERYIGSSPLTRGGPGQRPGAGTRPGLIPAYAGRTYCSKLDSFRPCGSSPLTRGGPPSKSKRLLLLGLIPAYAGRTSLPRLLISWVRAHPRLRGADGSTQPHIYLGEGSSPLTRGGLFRLSLMSVSSRLIPAYAGRTVIATGPWLGVKAHPRLRGADFSRLSGLLWELGSSPLTRGGQGLQAALVVRGGLIPAYAGRTPYRPCPSLSPGAHPRLRGADPSPLVVGVFSSGSSPLTRGGRWLLMVWTCWMGLIPAYAGRTLTKFSPLPPHRAHPRLRGADLAGFL